MMVQKLIGAISVFIFLASLNGVALAGENFPDRPIRLVIPSAAGGATDMWGRTLGSIMEKELGTKIIVNNMLGGASATAVLYTWNASHDGYTWVSVNDSTNSLPAMIGAKETLADNWVFFIAGASPGILCANAKSGLKTPEDFFTTIENEPGKLKLAYCAGGVWDNQASILDNTDKLAVTHVPIPGTRPAIISTVGGETDLVIASVMEVFDFIQNGDLVPLLMTGPEPYTFNGQEIKSATEFMPKYATFADSTQWHGSTWHGIMLPKDTPPDVLAAISAAFDKAMTSPEMADFAKKNYAIIFNLQGEKALEFAKNNERMVAWLLYDLGEASYSPESMGIER